MYRPIPCAHVIPGIPVKVKLDYHPLTSVNPALQQARLSQAVPGFTCPCPIEGPVADRIGQLTRLFMGGLRAGEFDVAAIIALTRRDG